jgi:hypothetical protein
MIVAFVCLHGGSEHVVARAESQDDLTAWMREHGLDTHPRLSRYRITGPQGETVVQHGSW